MTRPYFRITGDWPAPGRSGFSGFSGFSAVVSGLNDDMAHDYRRNEGRYQGD